MSRTALLVVVILPLSLLAEAWPFVILRNYGSYEGNRDFLERVFAAQERHPGLIEEIWFGGEFDPFGDAVAYGKAVARENLAAKARCEKLGIAFSYQEGITLNHDADDRPHPGIPDDAWVVAYDGRRRKGVFCCTSPFAIDFSERKARAVMAALHPASYWPDDDLRNMKILWDRPAICFCERCLKLFGERRGRTYTREELIADLGAQSGSGDVRRAWCAFNAEMLANFAAAYRRAADAVSPETRLGIQAACAFHTLNGDLYSRILPLFAGKEGRAGIRPGGGYYSDLAGRHEMLDKLIMTGHEAARAARNGATGQICYEVENWPHVGAAKSPGGMMSECALALAFGCDSIAFYWGADQNGESAESYDFWLETLAKWKPFLRTERDTFRDTFAGGLAMCYGEDFWTHDGWLNQTEGMLVNLSVNALPVTTTEAEPDVLLVNERSVRTLTTNDLPRVFAKPVLTDPAAFAALAEKFPNLSFTRKVSVENLGGERALATAERKDGYEQFGAFGKCENVKAKIRVKSPDVTALSSMTVDPATCGTCVIPTEFGGKVVIAQDITCGWPHRAWPGCRRHGILDALDAAVPGGMPVRLLTDGYALSLSVRKDAEGRVAGVFLLNLGTGETPPLELAIRRGKSRTWRVAQPCRPEIAAETVRDEPHLAVVRLPSISAGGVLLLRPTDGVADPLPIPQK